MRSQEQGGLRKFKVTLYKNFVDKLQQVCIMQTSESVTSRDELLDGNQRLRRIRFKLLSKHIYI